MRNGITNLGGMHPREFSLVSRWLTLREGYNIEEVELPSSILRLLKQIAYEAALGNAIAIVSVPKMLTVMGAAEFLDAPMSHITSLLDSGELQSVQIGTEQRILLNDLIAYDNSLR